MTDKEIIEIDGIDVSKCKHYKNGSCGIETLTPCLYYKDCYYKQLQKEKEYEELKNTVLTKCPNCNSEYLTPKGIELYEKNKRLIQECERLNTQLKELKRQYKLSCLDCEYKNTKTDADRYRKALEEIEELVKSLNENRMCFYDDVNDCSNCDMNTDCNYLRKFKILDIINKAKENL